VKTEGEENAYQERCSSDSHKWNCHDRPCESSRELMKAA
jgi:hypothetical protein